MTTTPLPSVPVRSLAELTQRWAELLDPPSGSRSLWLTWFGEDHVQLPLLLPIEGLPARPGPDLLPTLLGLHDTVLEQTGLSDGHLALALCRPGRAVVTDLDEEWADLLWEVLDDQLDGTWSLHLAAAGRVLPLVGKGGWW